MQAYMHIPMKDKVRKGKEKENKEGRMFLPEL